MALFAGAGLAGLAVVACGPSFQAVYECDVRFEHCYALDQGAAATSDAKKDCWRQWLHGYTYGQSRDRVEYAAQRFSELSIGNTLPSVDESETHRERAKHASAAPLPTNAFAPPPSVAEHAEHAEHAPPEASSASAHAASPPGSASAMATPFAVAPGTECATRCLEHWNGCKDGCKNSKCGESCDKTYRACVPGCFR